MSNVLALLSRSFFEKDALIDKKIAAVGDVVPLTEYHASHARLSTLDDGGSLFLVTVRPPYDRLLLVAELESPTHGDGHWEGGAKRWVAAANRMPVNDVSHLVDQLSFADGKGLRASTLGKLGPALQTPKVLTEADVRLLREAVATASDPVPAVPLSDHEAVEVESLLEQCLKLATTDPADSARAFLAARRAWQLTRWPDLARLTEELALLGESDAARRLRAGGSAATGGDWSALEQTLPDADRGVLLAGLPGVGAKEVLRRLEHIRRWEPDPRVSRALVALIRSTPWTMYEADPTWNLAFQVLAELHDPRLLTLRAKYGPSSWFGERVHGLCHRLNHRPAPPTWPAAEALLSDVERVVAGLSEAEQPGPQLPPAARAPLPTALEASATHEFTAVEVVDVRRCGTPRVLGIEINVNGTRKVVVTDEGGVPAITRQADGWALDPCGERLAILGEELVIYSVADGSRLAGVPYSTTDKHELRSPLVWADDDRLVVCTERGLVRFDLDTGTATMLAEMDKPWRVRIAVDPVAAVVLFWEASGVRTYNLRDGRLLQALDIGFEVGDGSSFRVENGSTAIALGDSRFALGCYVRSGTTGIATVDGISGAHSGEPRSGPVLDPLPWHPDEAVPVYGEHYRYDTSPLDRWMFGDGTAVTTAKAGKMGVLEKDGAKPVRSIAIAAPSVSQVATSPNGQVIAGTDGENALIWGGRPRGARLTFSAIEHIAVSRSGRVAVVAGERLALADSGGKRLATTKYRGLSRIAASAAHDRFAAIDYQNIVVFDEELTLRAVLGLPGRTGAPSEPESESEPRPAEKFTALAWDRTGRAIAAGTDQGRVLVVDEATGEATFDVDIPGPVREISFVPTHDALLVWADPALLLLVDRASGRVETWREPPGLTGLAVHTTCGWVATGHDDGRVELHTLGDPGAAPPDPPSDPPSAEPSPEVSLPVGRHFGPVTALCFAEDRLVVGAGRPGHRGSITTYQWTAPVGGAR